MKRRIAIAAAVAGICLAAPASAVALEGAFVFGGTLTFGADFGTVETITTREKAAHWVIKEATSPNLTAGPYCTVKAGGEIDCEKAETTRLSISTYDLDDSVVVSIPVPATIDGGDGGDTLTGGPLADELDGGAGDDTIFAQDGVADTVDCGEGDDRATVDVIDIVSNCEADPPAVVDEPVVLDTPKVDAPKAESPKQDAPKKGDGPRAALNPIPAVSPVAIVAGAVKVGRDGTAPLELGCPETEVGGCAGDVYLDPAPAGKAKKAKKAKAKSRAKVRATAARRGRFGRSAFVIAAGEKKNVKVRLSTAARAQLGLPTGKKARAARRGRRVKAVVTVVQRGRAAKRSIIELRG